MRSIGDDLRDEDTLRVARMTPAERVRLAHSLGEANLTLFQRAQHLDRRGGADDPLRRVVRITSSRVDRPLDLVVGRYVSHL